MVWIEPTNHGTDCYFCASDVIGMNKKNQDSLKYPDLQSTRDYVTVMKFRYLSSDNFLTLLTKNLPVSKKMKK